MKGFFKNDNRDEPISKGYVDSQLNEIAPQRYRKRIIGLGSSVLYGQGASGGNGWFNKLATLLTPTGCEFINKGIAGNTTVDCINRFYTDVSPYYPDFVILGLTLMNEGIMSGNPEAIYTQFKNNIVKLCRMIKEIGAIPIVCNTYPRNEYGATEYRYVRQFNKELEDMNVVSIDVLGAVDNLSGNWLTGAFADSGHPNDIGHEEMFRTIPPSIFDNLLNYQDIPKRQFNGYVELGTDGTTIAPIYYSPTDSFRSWTVSFWLKNNTGSASKAFCGIGGSNSQARVRNPSSVLVYTPVTGGADITSTADVVNNKVWHHVVLTHNEIEQVTRFYVNGSYVGSANESLLFTGFALAGRVDIGGSNPTGYQLKDLTIYRTRLNGEQVKYLYNGKILKSSLELYSPLNDIDVSQNTHLSNLAPTNSYAKVQTSALTSIIQASN